MVRIGSELLRSLEVVFNNWMFFQRDGSAGPDERYIDARWAAEHAGKNQEPDRSRVPQSSLEQHHFLLLSCRVVRIRRCIAK